MRTTLFTKYVDSGLMTQGELANLIGISEEHLSRIKHGRVPIAESFIARVCLALHAPRELLFFEDTDPAPSRAEAPTALATGPPGPRSS